MPDRQRAEPLDLAEPAGLEPRRHQREIAAGKDPPRLRVVEADADTDGIRPPPPRVDQRLLDLRLAASGDDDLAAGLDDLVGGRHHEVDALLVHEPGDQTKDRAAGDRQPELPADIVGVGLLALPVAGAERLRQVGAEAGIPALVDGGCRSAARRWSGSGAGLPGHSQAPGS
jgi:hypothetical protein